jgi:hypothetical protein
MTMKGNETEYDKDGKEMKGGGYMKKGGQLCKMEKSMELSGDDLEKSLDKLGEFAGSNDTETRKTALLQKAMEGELEKSERDELHGLMGGGKSDDDVDPTHTDTITKSLEGNDTLQKALDVSDYLREQHEELCKSLTQLAGFQEQADTRQHEFNLILAKAVSDTGTLVKAMSEKLGVIAGQPAHEPKSRMAPGQVLSKSFGGSPPDSEQLTKSMVLDTLDAMHVESMEKGMDGRTAAGESILTAIAKYENSNMLTKSMLAQVQSYRQAQATAG